MEGKLEALKQQVQADFELTWTMMNDQGRRLDARIDEVKFSLDQVRLSVDKMGAEIQEGNRQIPGACGCWRSASEPSSRQCKTR